MSFLSYTTGVPNPPNNPSTDVGPMQINTNSINSILNVDHFGFNNTLGGWHKIIHLPAQTVDPAPVTVPANAGQLYTKTISGDLELFYESSGGVISQLTAAGITPTPGTNGYSYIPGGILLQWGVLNTTFPSNVGTVTFATANIAFPNNCFNVQMTMKGTSGTANLTQITGISKTAFNWQFTGGSSTSFTGFYWYAVGN